MTVPASEEIEVARVLEVRDEASGLEAWIAIDGTEGDLSAGVIRCATYEDRTLAIRAAKRGARAATLACRAAKLPAGGAHIVVRGRPELDTERAYTVLGKQIGRLEPTCLFGPGPGIGQDELVLLREGTDRVPSEVSGPARATAVGTLTGIQAVCWALDGDPAAEGSRFLVQGYGPVGSFVANGLADQGGGVLVAETDDDRRRAADEAGFTTIEPEGWVDAAVDVLVPCAGDRMLTVEQAKRLAARGVCGSQLEPLASPTAGKLLHERGIQHVPGVVAGGGGLVEQVLTWREGRSQRVEDAIDRRLSSVFDRARGILQQAARENVPLGAIVLERWG